MEATMRGEVEFFFFSCKVRDLQAVLYDRVKLKSTVCTTDGACTRPSLQDRAGAVGRAVSQYMMMLQQCSPSKEAMMSMWIDSSQADPSAKLSSFRGSAPMGCPRGLEADAVVAP
jgi:hypothetical protein